jgi:dihydrofolate reductase
MTVRLIAALTRDRAIGTGGVLPWHLPADLARFKALTIGRTVVMGRRTAESIGRALPGRRNLVLTRTGSAPFRDQETVRSVGGALAAAGDGELYVIGGGEVYCLFLPYASKAHLTWVDATVPEADTFFPALDFDEWEELCRERHPADARHEHAFEFVDYTRLVSVD